MFTDILQPDADFEIPLGLRKYLGQIVGPGNTPVHLSEKPEEMKISLPDHILHLVNPEGNILTPDSVSTVRFHTAVAVYLVPDSSQQELKPTVGVFPLEPGSLSPRLALHTAVNPGEQVLSRLAALPSGDKRDQSEKEGILTLLSDQKLPIAAVLFGTLGRQEIFGLLVHEAFDPEKMLRLVSDVSGKHLALSGSKMIPHGQG